jgi:hypothetical protein
MFKINPKVVAKQSGVYAEAKAFKGDMPREGLKLTIGGREIFISGGIFQNFVGSVKDTQDMFQVFLNYLQKPETEGGVGLNEADAFHIFKQIVLAYRGQDGVGDGAFLVGVSLMDAVRRLSLQFNGAGIGMKFENRDGRFVLTEKTECSPILGIKSVQEDRFITSELRFKFPGDSEIRTQLSVTSTRIPSADGTIEWSCPFRENPPQKIILYGGCRRMDTH